MAKNDSEHEEAVQTPTSKDISDQEDSKDVQPATPEKAVRVKHAVKSQPPWPLIVVGVIATVLIIAVVAVGWLQLESLHRTTRVASRYGMQQNDPNFGTNSGNQGGYYCSGGSMRGRMTRPTLTGVVTAVTDSTVTVSGNGKQVTVDKTSSTTVSGDSTTIAVNDTVLVYGTTASDGTVTATRIVVRNGTTSDTSASANRPSV